MIGRAVRKLPRDFDVLVYSAQHAMRRKDWQQALHRWETVKGSGPAVLEGTVAWRNAFARWVAMRKRRQLQRSSVNGFPPTPGASPSWRILPLPGETWKEQFSAGQPLAGVTLFSALPTRLEPRRCAGQEPQRAATIRPATFPGYQRHSLQMNRKRMPGRV
jgi:hypothetical protein